MALWFLGEDEEDRVLDGFVPLLTALAKLDDFAPAIEGLRTGECKLVDGELKFGEIDGEIVSEGLRRFYVREWFINAMLMQSDYYNPLWIKFRCKDRKLLEDPEFKKQVIGVKHNGGLESESEGKCVISEASWEVLKGVIKAEYQQITLEMAYKKKKDKKELLEAKAEESLKALEGVEECLHSGVCQQSLSYKSVLFQFFLLGLIENQ
ncbi:hypothetical protein SELMODRAFT_426380 [Selaginella moellendorffii]|uniref:Uncharacterized protein n=1 Tax=Selaginella moellendorffii TaxID=88036 RepID=D8SW71_SELML|nr:hypothetical protein SELMODRAFT_426380 [Selaginella moellendorffii]